MQISFEHFTLIKRLLKKVYSCLVWVCPVWQGPSAQKPMFNIVFLLFCSLLPNPENLEMDSMIQEYEIRINR